MTTPDETQQHTAQPLLTLPAHNIGIQPVETPDGTKLISLQLSNPIAAMGMAITLDYARTLRDALDELLVQLDGPQLIVPNRADKRKGLVRVNGELPK